MGFLPVAWAADGSWIDLEYRPLRASVSTGGVATGGISYTRDKNVMSRFCDHRANDAADDNDRTVLWPTPSTLNSGDVIGIMTDDSKQYPLADVRLLKLSHYLNKVVTARGAADIYDTIRTRDDYDEDGAAGYRHPDLAPEEPIWSKFPSFCFETIPKVSRTNNIFFSRDLIIHQQCSTQHAGEEGPGPHPIPPLSPMTRRTPTMAVWWCQ
jgi:hypothetical protein